MRKRSKDAKDWRATPEKMDERINRLRTAQDCEIFSKNVTALGFPELASRAERRGVELQAATHEVKDATERAAFEAVYAYELALRKHTGNKKSRATGIWNMVRRHGIVETIQRSVNAAPDLGRYTTLKAIGMQDLAFESVVVNHRDEFAASTVEKASARLAEWVGPE
jgi:hypothetical protein